MTLLGLLACACAAVTPSTPQEPSADRMDKQVALASPEVLGLPASDAPDGDIGASRPESPETEDASGRWLVAPIPFVSPTIGPGLALGAGYMFELDESSPPSIVGGGGMYSENGSFGGAVGFKAYFDEDRYRLSGGLVTTRLVFDYATPSGDVPLRENVVGLALELLVRAWERVYVGPVVLLAGVDTDLVRSQDQGKIPDDQLEADNLWFGIRAQRDTRDSVYYPRSGSLADLQVRTSAGGSDFDFTVVPIAYNHFFELGDRDVLAVRGAARSAFGDVPFYGESYFGADSDLRGYAVGTYHDDALLAGQAEYRRELFWRLGGVAFAGVGTVAPSLGELDQGELLPSAGLGLRITLDEKSHLNYRIDYAWGRDQSALYLSVGEAF